MRRIRTCFALCTVVGLASSMAQANHLTRYATDLIALNNSGVNGTARFVVNANDMTLNLRINATGLEVGSGHAMHIHGRFDGMGTPIDSFSPTLADDADNDGFVEVLEGVGRYGDIILPLGSIVTATGDISYNQTFDLTNDSLFFSPVTNTDYASDDIFPLDFREIVIHGLSTTAQHGASTGGEVNGTAGFKGSLPVASGEIVGVPEPASLGLLSVAALLAGLPRKAHSLVGWNRILPSLPNVKSESVGLHLEIGGLFCRCWSSAFQREVKSNFSETASSDRLVISMPANSSVSEFPPDLMSIAPTSPLRLLGSSSLRVSPVALGTWPLAGVTSLGVSDADSLATIRACGELGVNFIDTAYVYGPNGESENLIRRTIGPVRDQFVLATKCGIHYEGDKQVNDARPEVILAECDESLRRLGADVIDLYYLHSPDPQTPVAESAGAIRRLVEAGKVRYAAVSNCSLEQIQAFCAACPIVAVQLPYNMLQRDIEELTLPWCRENNIGVVVYWALMKGLLAGKITRLEQLGPDDARRKYPMYQGEEWERNQAFLDELRTLADECDRTVAEVVVNWTMHQPGITSVLCGAKRPEQITDSAAAMGWQLSTRQNQRIDAALAARGKAAAKRIFR